MPQLTKNMAGFSLIEILVTVAITIIGLVGLASLQLQVTKSVGDSGNRSQVIWMLEDLSNRMKANRIALADYNTDGDTVSCDNAPKICSAYHDGSARVEADLSCSNTEQAQSDLWEVACGFNPDVDTYITKSSAVDFIAAPLLSTQLNGGEITVTISWDTRTSGVNADGELVYANTDSLANSRTSLTMVYNP